MNQHPLTAEVWEFNRAVVYVKYHKLSLITVIIKTWLLLLWKLTNYSFHSEHYVQGWEAKGQRGEWILVYVVGRWVENVNSPATPHREDVGPPMAWYAAGGESVCAGSVFAKSVSRGCIMGHGVNVTTGSVQHMTGRPVVVSTIKRHTASF